MKTFYILLALAILGGSYWYATTDTEMSEETKTVVDSQVLDTNTSAESTEHDMEDESADVASRDANTDDTSISVDPNAKIFNVGGANYEYDIKSITVKEGDTVIINFKSNGGFHDFVIDEFDAKTERVGEGKTSSVTFVANKAGTFEYYCSVGSHRAQGMVGTLIVE